MTLSLLDASRHYLDFVIQFLKKLFQFNVCSLFRATFMMEEKEVDLEETTNLNTVDPYIFDPVSTNVSASSGIKESVGGEELGRSEQEIELQEQSHSSLGEEQEDSNSQTVWCRCGNNCPPMENRSERICCMDEAKWQDLYNASGHFYLISPLQNQSINFF